MQVILLERIEKLGSMGNVVKVRDGFARNYLIPQGKALRATKRNIDDFENRRVQIEANNLARREEAQAAAGDIEGKSVVILRQASESTHLYGSVAARDIVAAFEESGITFAHQQVRLDAPLKTLGLHEVRIALHPEVDVTVTVNVARSQEEADIQAGKAAPPSDEDENAATKIAPSDADDPFDLSGDGEIDLSGGDDDEPLIINA